MVIRKRISTKTGNFSKRMTTLGDKGKTESYSSKPPGGRTRRTVSYHNGNQRVTYSTRNGGGYTTIRSKTTTLVRKSRKARKSTGRSRRSRGGSSSFPWFWFFIIAGLLVLAFL